MTAIKFIGDVDEADAILRKLKRRKTANVFCATGPGGGVDPSCSPGGAKAPIPITSDGKYIADFVKGKMPKEAKIVSLVHTKIAYLNPNGIQNNTFHMPLSTQYKTQLEVLKKVLPPGTVIKVVDVKEHHMQAGQKPSGKVWGIAAASEVTPVSAPPVSKVHPVDKPPTTYGELKAGSKYTNSLGHVKEVESVVVEGGVAKIKFKGEEGIANIPTSTKLPKLGEPAATPVPAAPAVKPAVKLPAKPAKSSPWQDMSDLNDSLETKNVIHYKMKPLDGIDYSSRQDIALEHWENNRKKLTQAEISSLRSYTGTTYSSINSAMRQCPPQFECVKGASKTHMDNMESAIAKMPDFKQPIHLERSMSSDEATAAAFLAALRDVKGTDATINFPSFTSTSTSSRSGGTTFRILAKRGISVRSISKFPSEDEVILSPKQKFKVKDIYKNNNGTRFVELEEI